MKKKSKQQLQEDEKFPLPIYKKEDDIYNREEEEPLEDEDNPKVKAKSDRSVEEGLDIPGSELDDADEAIGEEDEENNYYSLGGDSHDNLEEDQA